MSHFYGSLKGMAKTTATRRGTKRTGVEAHVRGWNIGGRVEAYVNPAGHDCIRFVLTRGSNDGTEIPGTVRKYRLHPDEVTIILEDVEDMTP